MFDAVMMILLALLGLSVMGILHWCKAEVEERGDRS